MNDEVLNAGSEQKIGSDSKRRGAMKDLCGARKSTK